MRRQFRVFHGKTLKAGSACPGFINVARPRQPLPVFLDDLQWLDAATLDKAVEMKVDFYPAYLKAWAWVRRMGKSITENLRTRLPMTGP